MKLLRTWRTVVSAAFAVSVWSRATAATAVAPAFKSLRYDEDYSHLRESADRRTWGDALKHIRLDAGSDSYVTLGGEVRQRYEYYRHAQWGEGPQDASGYLLQRYMLHAEAHLGPRFRLFAQLRGAYETGRIGGPRGTDEDPLDFGQAFFDIAWQPSEHRAFAENRRAPERIFSERIAAA